VVSGERARETFFTAKGLDLTEGFKILSGAVSISQSTILNEISNSLHHGQIPMVRGVTSDLQTRRISLIHKRLANVQRNLPLSSREHLFMFLYHLAVAKPCFTVIPLLLEDTRKMMEGWGTSGKFDPFDNVYEVSVIKSLSPPTSKLKCFFTTHSLCSN
jgi:hypothetical protein